MKPNCYFKSAKLPLTIFLLFILLSSCTVYQNVPDNDGIYTKEIKRTRVIVENSKEYDEYENNYFTKEKISGIAYPLSLFEKEKNVELIKKSKAPSVVFLFKALDSLEMLKRNYSKELLLAITPLVDKVVVSFATKSLVRRSKFKVQRIWLTTFLEENFKILDDFEIGGERYISFKKEI